MRIKSYDWATTESRDVPPFLFYNSFFEPGLDVLIFMFPGWKIEILFIRFCRKKIDLQVRLLKRCNDGFGIFKKILAKINGISNDYLINTTSSRWRLNSV